MGLVKEQDFLSGKWVLSRSMRLTWRRNWSRRLCAAAHKILRSIIAFFVGDAQDLPFPNGCFDAVVNFGIIHHVLDWRRCISELSRVTRPGGAFYFEEIYPPLYANFLLKRLVRHPTSDRFSGAQFLEALEHNKFQLAEGVCTTSRFGIVGVATKNE